MNFRCAATQAKDELLAMIGLLPNELWDFRLVDVFLQMTAVLGRGTGTTAGLVGIRDLGVCLPARSGRVAIIVALNAVGLGSGARVGIPLYCCPVVFKAVAAAGCVIKFLDVDSETYCVSTRDVAAKRAELDAIVAVHMFGNVCDMVGLRKVAAGIPIIEDCAQGLGSRLNGQPVGSFGDVAFFSFRSGKYLSVGEGAALFTRNPALRDRITALVGNLPSAGRGEECVHVLKTYLKSLLRSKPLWGLIGLRIWNTYNQKVKYASKSPIVMGRIYESDLALVMRRLPFLDLWIERQRANSEYYLRNLNVDAGMLCREKPGMFYNRLQFPILTKTPEQCEKLVADLFRNGVTAGRPYKQIVEIAKQFYGYTGDCPNAERIARTVLVIPCHYALKPRQVERIALTVNRSWARLAGRSSQFPSRSLACISCSGRTGVD